MKKIFIILLSLLFIPYIVNAKEITNNNGVAIEEDIYNKLCELYSKLYVDDLPLEDYDYIMSIGINNIETVTLSDNFFSGARSTGVKIIKITKAGNKLFFKVNWNRKAYVRSWDVIGFRYEGSVTAKITSFKQIGSDRTIKNTYYSQEFSNGIGLSFLLLESNATEISVDLQTNGSGTLYATYQHATKLLSRVKSEKYTISDSGLGSVLNFDSSVKSYYDGMNGISISI